MYSERPVETKECRLRKLIGQAMCVECCCEVGEALLCFVKGEEGEVLNGGEKREVKEEDLQGRPADKDQDLMGSMKRMELDKQGGD